MDELRIGISISISGLTQSLIEQWVAALEARHLSELRVPEVTRALRALSSAYVERRKTVSRGGALDSAGKRAAFALFYAPLHFLATTHVVGELGAAAPPPSSILDIGCGTGAGGAAWALAAGGVPVTGIDRHPWAVEEARRTYRHFGLRGIARQGDVSRLPAIPADGAVIAAYVLNELNDDVRRGLEDRLLAAARRGARVLILEPIARGVTPWWAASVDRFAEAGGRADEWRFTVDLPPFVRLLDKAAGLDHRELTVKSLYCDGRTLPGPTRAARGPA